MRLLIVLLVLTLASCGPQGEDISISKGNPIGLMLLGLLSPNAGEILDPFIEIQKTSPLPVTAILWKSFGDDRKAINQYIEAVPQGVIEIHLSNEAGRRNERLGPSDLFPQMSVQQFNHALEFHTHDEEIKRWILDVVVFAVSPPKSSNITFLLSLGLESNYTPLAAMNLLKLALEVWPYEIVYNPISNDCSYMPQWVYCETHGIDAPTERERCIVGLDGRDSGPRGITLFGNPPASFEEVLAFIRRGIVAGCITLLWSAESQGIQEPFVPTLERRFQLHPLTVDFFHQLLSEF